jgi:ribonucleoside-diphosphate reductase alpha chain
MEKQSERLEQTVDQRVEMKSLVGDLKPGRVSGGAARTLKTSSAGSRVKRALGHEQGEVEFSRFFTREIAQAGKHPLDVVPYVKSNSKIKDTDGRTVFQMTDVEVPAAWSQLAVDILVSKYFRKAGVPTTGHEVSVRQVIKRVAHTIRVAGEHWGYFGHGAAEIFEEELSYLLIHQMAAFNSPVWFNLGLFQEYGIEGSGGNFAWDSNSMRVVETKNAYSRPQCSACFIQSVDDDLMSIFQLVKNEARLFKYGSGTGTNFSKIRG